MMPRPHVLVALLAALPAAACGTDPLSDGGNGTPVLVGDAGGSGEGPGLDGGNIGIDAGGEDGGNVELDVVLRDTTTNDSGIEVVCEPRSTECDGDVLLTCAGDGSGYGRTRCEAFGQVCTFTPDGVAACMDEEVVGPDPICEPGTAECAADGASLLVCSDNGMEFIAEDCPNGCDPDRAACVDDPVEPGDCPLEVEDLNFADGNASVQIVTSLCGAGNDAGYEPGQGDCEDYESQGEDRIYTFTVDGPTLVSVDLRDADGTVAIDTVAYLRTSCDDAGSQLACGDDVACTVVPEVQGCSGGEQVRVSQFEQVVEGGTYFIVIDSFNYRTGGGQFGCGTVQLTVGLASAVDAGG